MLKPIKSVTELGESSVKVTADLNRFLETMPPDQQQLVMEKVFVYTYNYLVEYGNMYFERYQVPEAIEKGLLITAYQLIDKINKKSFATTKPTCHNQPLGCFHCCYINVDISDTEAKLLLDYCEEKGIVIDWAKVEHIAKLAPDLETFEKLPYADRRCVFLGKDNLCTVYDSRPISCRAYHVASNVKFCHTEKKSYKTSQFNNIEIEIVKSCLLNLLNLDPESMINIPATLMKFKPKQP